MKCEWLYRQHRERLILFCNGWGMDATPFQPLTATDVDVLMLFDYHDLRPVDGERNNPAPDLDLDDLFRRYSHISLIAWSMGVWAGQQLFRPWARFLRESIAINGTLCPIDDGFGIPIQVYAATLAQFNEDSRLKFYRRMCHHRNILAAFLAHQPQRTITSQHRELATLQDLTSCQPAESAIYSKVVVTTRDLVMPTANQLAFWQGHDILTLAGSHFPFYRWDSWEKMLEALT
jgi:biotin synthesis protein BioG